MPSPTLTTTPTAAEFTGDRLDCATMAGWLERGDDVRLLDVRSPAEFETAHIPGSYNVPLNMLGEHADEIRAHLDVPVVIICRSGGRAAQANRTLAGSGMSNTHILEGGLMGWDDGSRPLTRGEARWDIERQVRMVAGSMIAGSVLASVKFPKARFLAGAVGGGLAFAAASNTCMMGNLLGRLPYNQSNSCDIDKMVDELTGRA
ncbi:rhodanese-like domain-containing protein [Candidatus Microthrix sp.]|jgi:rhodanese-related sulfurtransferase|nr:rhodanese-like domain-containing protein [Candidatus Microthrix sp.]HMS46309.1 rhodanese-like domain-containing protein [Candidatus Microthrix sp.]